MLHRLLSAGAALLLLAACGERGAPTGAAADAAATSTATPTATSTAISAPTSTSTDPMPAPAEPAAATPVRSAVAVEAAGRVVLAPEVETIVDPAATFEIELGAAVPDARLILFDPQDAHVAATAAREVAATTRVSLAPAAPLLPGSRYLLRLDGAVTRELHDATGRAYRPVSFPLLVAGTPPAPEPRKKPRRRR